MPQAHLNNSRDLLPWQLEVVRAQEFLRIVVGGYASGKTAGCAMALAAHACATPHTEAYGSAQPESIVLGMTDSVLRESSFKALDEVVPAELIAGRHDAPQRRDRTLINGHVIRGKTWKGALEGNTATAFWMDEGHQFEASPFTNYVARLRDPKSPNRLFLISGIPEWGSWVQELFADGTYPESRLWQISTYSNTYLLPADIARIEASCDTHSALTYLRGQFAAPKDAIYWMYDVARHIVPSTGDPASPCHLGIDVGDQGAVIWGQRTDSGMLICDEYMPQQQDIADVCETIRARKWRVNNGSKIFLDPAVEKSVKRTIVKAFPSATVVQLTKGQVGHRVDYGIRSVRAALENVRHEVRLTFAAGLPRTDRSILTAIPKYRRNPVTGKPVKDNKIDHGLDALRYLVQGTLPALDPVERRVLNRYAA